MKSLKVQFLCAALLFVGALGQFHEDKRCLCICPSPVAVINSNLSNNVKPSEDRRLFVANVPPNQCNCDGVILPRIGKEVSGYEQLFCPRCECKFQTRNTTVIMFVVVLIVWVTTLLIVYMGFLKCLQPLIKRKTINKFYGEKGTEETRNLLKSNEDAED